MRNLETHPQSPLNMFSTASTEPTRPEPDDSRSFGLGLAIAREITESHGGSIKVKSSAEDGTVFTVVLPLSK
ncbi:MAG: ATP-binding protein [Eggerthellaceae bacterium]